MGNTIIIIIMFIVPMDVMIFSVAWLADIVDQSTFLSDHVTFRLAVSFIFFTFFSVAKDTQNCMYIIIIVRVVYSI